MEYRNLGHSGCVVSAYALGTMTFGAEASEVVSHRIMDDYVEAGGNFLDTADVYGAGASEEIIGRWLAGRPGLSDQLVIASKARFPMGTALNDRGTSRKHLGRALDATLGRLGVEHLDLYQMHAWDPLTPLEETLHFLHDAVTAGKISYYGFSNFLGWQLSKAVYVARANGWHPPVTLQPQYSLLVREIELEVVPAALDAGLGLLPWSPLAGGWLSGKYRRNQGPGQDTRYGDNPGGGMETLSERNDNERAWEILAVVEELAGELGTGAAQVALAWTAQRPAVTSVILGARTREQLAANLEAAELSLSEEALTRLDDVSAPRPGIYPYGEKAKLQRSRMVQGGR